MPIDLLTKEDGDKIMSLLSSLSTKVDKIIAMQMQKEDKILSGPEIREKLELSLGQFDRRRPELTAFGMVKDGQWQMPESGLKLYQEFKNSGMDMYNFLKQQN